MFSLWNTYTYQDTLHSPWSSHYRYRCQSPEDRNFTCWLRVWIRTSDDNSSTVTLLVFFFLLADYIYKAHIPDNSKHNVNKAFAPLAPSMYSSHVEIFLSLCCFPEAHPSSSAWRNQPSPSSRDPSSSTCARTPGDMWLQCYQCEMELIYLDKIRAVLNQSED